MKKTNIHNEKTPREKATERRRKKNEKERDTPS